ncbi:hypothetical protein [Parvularcula marina]|uniref:Uncharacterized protein n=1 Tax=Parvularcula marina TaxID=2292771 RepID=A0A371RIC9_9PROT|nr:hypothetical protein [Parvularcula marina]RFB05192.1 hypothetical protein DX908_07945 [Parvularcula marina]
MTRWLSAVLAVFCVGSGSALAEISAEDATYLLREGDAEIRAGYAREMWIYKDSLWIEALECWGQRSLLGAKSTCLVCSIDDTSGQEYYRPDLGVIEGRVQPATAVGIQASYAYFTLQPNGWTLTRYKPFAANYYARSREPYHRANLNNLIQGEAQRECRDLEAVSGTE